MIQSPNEFFLPGGRSGVLLIHGLTGTPSEMRFVGKGLQARGFTVYGVQLAGHCEDEAALVATGWRDWYASVADATRRLRPQVDQLFVAGLSMGAVLALHLAASEPESVAGIALYGTTLSYDGWAIPRKARLAFLLPWMLRLGIGRGRRFEEAYPMASRTHAFARASSSSCATATAVVAGCSPIPGRRWRSSTGW